MRVMLPTMKEPILKKCLESMMNTSHLERVNQRPRTARSIGGGGGGGSGEQRWPNPAATAATPGPRDMVGGLI